MGSRRISKTTTRRASSLADELAKEILRLPGVSSRRSHWADGVAYYVGTREIVHFHGAAEVDVRVTREVSRQLRSARPPDPRLRFRHSGSDWVATRLEDLGDVRFALALCEEALRANQ